MSGCSALTPGASTCSTPLAARRSSCEEVDTLVTALGQQSETTLEAELAGWGGEVLLAGDCLSPRTAEEAVLEGLKAGVAV